MSSIAADIIDHDVYLAKILTRGPYVLGHTFLFKNIDLNQQTCTLHPVSLDHRKGKTPSPVTNWYKASGVICNYQVLADAVSASGFLNGTADSDGVIRRLPLLIEFNDKVYPSFALAVLMQFRQHNELITHSDSGSGNHLFLADYHFPTDETGKLPIGPDKTGKIR